MKKKDLKKLAEKIAEQELIIQQNSDEASVEKAKEKIMKFSGSVTDFQDLDLLDEMIQEILEKS